ncbi:TPA: site-specific DNA-methyltransferase [Proteus mirabilis]|uniref:site-specific DNA-methyltransferase n=2 Tax=Enterobacterales TaxID=91347 RepID=UPI0013D35CDF|nr:site-specific DNA-methyltransferase [Proteus mirabilis]EGT3587416.1 site-specific DNA-methyltransferase [Proteus mirabilis]EKV6230216.1 site-specific DNA-methyltransferase [Proteus mirabilis]EKV6231793.1 site-specific DNA-methyltransferase [Proteus mirabilis]MBG2848654.1 site-specific DNA-methyltransferase [Proteus mirabilis]MBG3005529.1 site-specific DNA-methyltransferase [Proteus mirabilis]
MPTLDFKGKQFVYSHHLSVPFRELKVVADKSLPLEGKSASLDDNLIIHGDNLEALKALLPTHAGKVDCIFIDPPYNTGNEGWCYNDNVRSPLMQEWLKKSANPVDKEDMERHDKWLCMMWPRVSLLRELLSEYGAIFITIDDNEFNHLKILCDEVFGESNFISTIATKANPRGRQSDTYFATVHEYCLVYAKNKEYLELNGVALSDDKASDYKNSDDDGELWRELGLRQRGAASLREERPDMYFPIYVNPESGLVSLTEGNGYSECVVPQKADGRDGRWMWSPKKVKEEILRVYGRLVKGKDGKARFDVFIKDYKNRGDVERTEKPTTLWNEKAVNTELGGKLLKSILGKEVFKYPKPVGLLEKILQLATHKNSIILDSFAGSGTTAHAVLEANNSDEGNRKFILIECEDYADKVTAERVRRVINGYPFKGNQKQELLSEKITWSVFEKKHAELLEKIAKVEAKHSKDFDKIKKELKDGVLTVTGERKVDDFAPGIGGSFTYCTLGEPIQIESLLTDEAMPSFDALARYVFYTATGQSLETVAKASADGFIGETDLFRIHLFYRPDSEWLRSNEAALNADKVEAIAKNNATKKRTIVFAVAKFMSQKDLTEKRIEFCQLPYAIHRIMGA